MDDAADQAQAITVGVRIRPLNKKELDENQEIGWEFSPTSILESTMSGKKVYNFDVVLHPDTMNPGMYTKIAQRVVDAAMEGFNGTVFTYGQTGSGKTHSMMGTPGDPGVIRGSIHSVFSYIEAHEDHEFVLRVSYIEVYNEELNDLLSLEVGGGQNLRILKDDPQKGAVIEHLTEEIVSSAGQLVDVVARGESNRHYACTEMNATSSRSHTIYRLIIESKPPPEVVTEVEDEEFAAQDGGDFVSLGGEEKKDTKTTRVSYLVV